MQQLNYIQYVKFSIIEAVLQNNDEGLEQLIWGLLAQAVQEREGAA